MLEIRLIALTTITDEADDCLLCSLVFWRIC